MSNLHDVFQPRLEEVLVSENLVVESADLDATAKKLMDYLCLLQKWNKVYNLTAIRDTEAMLVKHIFDSIIAAKIIEGDRVIDVGSGAGLPGVPLAILFPNREVDLLDSNRKKTHFLTQVKAQLSLDNVSIIQQRVEQFKPNILYDAVVSRAFASFTDMVLWTKHLLIDNGCWWALKSQGCEQEVAGLDESVKIAKIHSLSVPDLDAQRILIQAIKLNRTIYE